MTQPTRAHLNLLIVLAVMALVPMAAAQEPAGPADMDLAVHTELVRTWPLPSGTSGFSAVVDHSVDGTTLLMMGRGAEETEECVIALSTPAEARSYTLRYDHSPTRCFAATAHPDGGFFVRGEVTSRTSRPGGFTLRADADGGLLWVVEDEELVDSSFQGDYGGPLPGLYYAPELDLLLGLTLGVRRLPGSDVLVTQAHVIQASVGDLRVTAKTFGGATPDFIVDATARDTDFLLHTHHGLTGATRFFSYDGSALPSPVSPGGLDWEVRELPSAPTFHRDAGTFLLWTDADPARSRAGIVAFDGPDLLPWSETFDGPGEPDRLWSSRDLLALRYRDDDLFYTVRFIDPATGEPLGLFTWSEITDASLVDFLRLSDGSLGVLAADGPSNQVGEFRLELLPASEVPEPQDPDDGSDDTDDPDDGGCSATGSPSPSTSLLLLIAIGLLLSPRHRV